jgi:hypothetical protein
MFFIAFLLRIFKKSKLPICLLALSVLTSCELTEKMWEHGYEDEIEGFVISDDRRHVALLGEKYDYIFEDKFGAIGATLGITAQDVVFLNDEKLHIKHQSNDVISGHLVFESYGKDDLSRQNFFFIQSLGFKPGKGDIMVGTFEIKGRRYVANEALAQRGSAFKNPYHVEIHEPNKPITTVEKTIATPITLTADAFLFVGEVAKHLVAE